MNTKNIYLFLFSIILFSGCEGFLDLSPQTTRNANDFYKNPDDFNTALIGSYQALRGIYAENMAYMGEISTDNTTRTTPRNAGNVDHYQFVDLAYASLNSVIYAQWRDHYKTIGRVNAIIGRIGAIEMSADRKSQYLGEAQFLRALLHFNLVRWFGKVPLVTKEMTNPDEANNLSRDEVDIVYQQIIDDLKEAENNLPVTLPSSDLGRATKGAAKTLLGKVYLTRKEYQLAVNKLAEVMDKNVFPNYRILSEYKDVFSWNTPVNNEIIFNIQYQSGNTGQGSNYGRMMVPGNAAATVLGPQGGQGAAVNLPEQDLIDAYEDGDKRKEFCIREYYLDASGEKVFEAYSNKYIQFNCLAGDSDVDFPVLRYADVILMYAEALNELGRTSDALPYLNEVRTRSGLEEKENLNQGDFRLVIEQERRVEFAFEFQRWFDLARTGRYLEVMRSKGYKPQDHYILYLIPQRELDINPNLGQNPGYSVE